MKHQILELLKEAGYYGHVITKKLPKELDNRLYTLIHLIGGMTTQDVYRFVEEATEEEIKKLGFLVNNFPSEQHEILPYAGGYRYLVTSPQYKEILKLIKKPKFIRESVEIGWDGFPTPDTNPYFTKYFNPKFRNKLFKYWDSVGKASYDALKLFGIKDDVDRQTSFSDVMDIVYPILALQWIGGVGNTEFAKAGWKNTDEMGFQDLKFKVEPLGYDYMFDESENFGEQGYSCWDIRVLIDVNENIGLDDSDHLKELFPESAQNELMSFHSYTQDQMYLIEGLWEYYEQEANEYFTQFCHVEVSLV